MSLLVWLPLIKDNHNQGLLNLTPTNQGTISFIDGGKLGKCLSAGNSSQTANGISYNSTLVNELGTKFSASIWVKPLGNHVHYNGTFVSSGNWNGHRWSFGVNQTNTQVDVFGNGHNKYVDCSVPVNQWTHLVCTNDNGVVKLYKNGEYVTTTTITAGLASDAGGNFMVGRETYANGYFSFNGNINDVRIYNHILSPKEIEILSRGLVCHYPLNGGGRGGDNILKETNLGKSGWTWSAASGSRSVETYDVTGVKMTVVEVGSSWNMWYFTSANLASSLQPDTDYTVSVDILPPQDAYINCGIIQTNSSNPICPFVTQSVKANKWNHLIFNLHSNSSFTASNQVVYMNGIAPDTVGKTIYLKNLKMELGTVATPWIPNPADSAYTAMGYNSTTEYDVSGYGYNGTKANITYSNNSARYSTSSTFNGSSSRIYIPNFSIGNEWSYGCWLRCNSLSGSWQAVAILNNTGGDADIQLGCYAYPTNSVFQSSANGKYNSGIACPHDTNWHYFFATYDGASLKTYVDGTLVATNSVTAALLARTNLTIGARCSGSGGSSFSNYFNGDLSDFRIYATALSATQVAELYNTAVSVANNGTLMGYELVEG